MRMKKIVIKINKDKYCCEADKLKIERIKNGFLINDNIYCETTDNVLDYFGKIILKYFEK